ncbi:MAG TPA: ferritin-like domain-containing protein [Accumulibacter sp.]|nr:ferritin-like domain-containing protein [Accumulibacter sp.]
MLRSSALAAISLPTYAGKLRATEAIDMAEPIDTQIVLIPETVIPGRESLPPLVPPSQLRKRSMASSEGRAVLIHALAHIELNAIDLGLDIVWRFPAMPEQFYRDWIRIAQEEASHFRLLSDHLHALGFRYGDFPAHNGLWEMAGKTSQDLLARLALVPRTLEARGLDAAVPIRDKLKQVGDRRAADILDIILRDEIGHVAVGNQWYRFLCAQRGLDPVATYASLAVQYAAPRLRGPFNLEARRAAGFDEEELAALQSSA